MESNWFRALLDVSPIWLYIILGGLVFLESAVLLGLFLPGETAVIVAGVFVSLDRLSFTPACVVACGSTILGYAVGYELGRVIGPTMADWSAVHRWKNKIDKGNTYFRHRGSWSVLFGRFLPFMRTLIPGIAGMCKMPWLKFTVANIVGGVVWGVGFVTLGYVASLSYERFSGWISTVGLVIAVITTVYVWRKLRD